MNMVRMGVILMDGVQVAALCKQNGKWYVMENTDFGYRRPFNYKQEAIDAVRKWWNE
jgi:hypothetical protein